MNDENIKEILKSIGSEQVPADVQELAQETSNNFSRSLTQQQPKPRQPILLEYIMRSRLPKLAAAAAVLIVAVLIGLYPDNSVAWSQLVEHVAKIKTVAYKMDMTMKGFPGVPEGESVNIVLDAKMEYDKGFLLNATTNAGREVVETKSYVLFDENAMFTVLPKQRKYMKMKLTGELLEKMKKENGDPRSTLRQMMEYEYTKLGHDTIDGIRVEGIEVTDPAMMMGMVDTLVARLWCDVKTDLPVLMTIKGTTNNGNVVWDMTLRDYEWNVAIDSAELEPDITEDYEMLAEAEIGGSKDGKDIVESLKFFSEMADGRYPSSLTGMTAVTEFVQIVRSKPADQQPSEEEVKGVMGKIVNLQMIGMAYDKMVQDGNEPAYYGDKVTTEFPHAVLFRWKLRDNLYRVVFGDLSMKDVTPEKMAELEALPLNLDPRPIKPDPADGTEGMALKGIRLKWMAGAYASEHKIHFGTSPDELKLLGTTNVAEFDSLPDLERGTTYYWRVDAVTANGKVTQGDVWTLDTGSLVAWYKFDQGSGDVIADSGPSGIDGSAHGDPAWADGVLGKAMAFDGNDAYVNLGNDPKFNITNQITVSAWIKVNAFDRSYQTIISKGDTSWRLQRNAGTDTLEFGCMGLPVPNNVTWGGIFGKIGVNDGQWHHAVGTYDGRKISLYVDCVLDVSEDVIGSIKTNDHPVYIGQNAEKPGRFWNGLIDDVRVYSYALSADEIANIFSSR